MTDKQIIIDGYDVSGCNFTLERDGKIKCECCHATGFGVICDCESWKTCDYKNYKRKEQECEELQKTANAYNYLVKLANYRLDKIEDLQQQLKAKEQECEELKEQLQKYRSAFEEIREDMEQDTTCESRECGCDDYAECLNCIKETILNKISEVENEF